MIVDECNWKVACVISSSLQIIYWFNGNNIGLVNNATVFQRHTWKLNKRENLITWQYFGQAHKWFLKSYLIRRKCSVFRPGDDKWIFRYIRNCNTRIRYNCNSKNSNYLNLCNQKFILTFYVNGNSVRNLSAGRYFYML